MKKLVLMFVAIAAISFASCGGNTKSNANSEDSVDTTSVDSADTVATVDSAATDSVAK